MSVSDRTALCGQSHQPQPIFNPETGEYSLSLSVMTYNVQGMPQELDGDRSVQFNNIRDSLNDMIGSKEAGPDVLVVQEMFTAEAITKLQNLNYPNFVYGPTLRDTPASLPVVRFANVALAAPNIKVLPSGVAIFSRYPIKGRRKSPFGYISCSGADCFANKGVMLAEIAIPGVPAPIRVVTTHMNSQDASKMPYHAHLHAHHEQSQELRDFLDSFDDQIPMIIAGDFNMRNSPERFAYFKSLMPYKSAHHYCHYNRKQCRSSVQLKGAAPWLTTQDLQFYKDGTSVKLHPLELSHWFDAPHRGGKLSDHDAQLVHWKLSWPNHIRPIAGSCDFKGIPSLKELLG